MNAPPLWWMAPSERLVSSHPREHAQPIVHEWPVLPQHRSTAPLPGPEVCEWGDPPQSTPTLPTATTVLDRNQHSYSPLAINSQVYSIAADHPPAPCPQRTLSVGVQGLSASAWPCRGTQHPADCIRDLQSTPIPLKQSTTVKSGHSTQVLGMGTETAPPQGHPPGS